MNNENTPTEAEKDNAGIADGELLGVRAGYLDLCQSPYNRRAKLHLSRNGNYLCGAKMQTDVIDDQIDGDWIAMAVVVKRGVCDNCMAAACKIIDELA